MNSSNAMAVAKSCPVLEAHYKITPTLKMKYINGNSAGRELLQNLPDEISIILHDAFLEGMSLKNIPGGNEVIEYCLAQSEILPELKKFPGTYTMLERMYGFEKVINYPIDVYFTKSLPAFPTLSSRYRTVNEIAKNYVKGIVNIQGDCLMIDIGSGPGRNGIDLLVYNPELKDKVKIENIEIDPSAIQKGNQLIGEHRLTKNIEFVPTSMTRLGRRYNQTVDFGLLIGILCGLTFEERVGLLKIIKPYFKSGGILVAAGLLDKMLELDLFCSFILKETADWSLQYPPLGELEKAMREAGYDYHGYAQDEYGVYEIGVGIVQ